MEYLNIKEAAEKWDISEQSVRRFCRLGRIPGAIQDGSNGLFSPNKWYFTNSPSNINRWHSRGQRFDPAYLHQEVLKSQDFRTFSFYNPDIYFDLGQYSNHPDTGDLPDTVNLECILN